MNIFKGSYLNGGFDKHFDIIVMNPPYNTYPINGKTHPLTVYAITRYTKIKPQK